MADFTPIANPAFTYTLDTPIRAGNDEVTEIAMRAPLTGDIMAVGDPIKIKQSENFDFETDHRVALEMIERLTGLPQVALKQMIPSDYKAIVLHGLLPFLIPGFSPRLQKQLAS